MASTSVEKLGHLRSYVFPPLVRFETVPAAEFQPLSDQCARAKAAAMSDILLILLPGAMYFWVLFIGQWPLQEVLQEQESRILPRILSCPVTPGQYVLSKLLRCFVLCSLAVSCCCLRARCCLASSGATHCSWR